MILWIVLALQGLVGYGHGATLVSPSLTPRAAAAVAPVAEAYGAVEAAQSRLPPATTDRERLLRLQERDQAGRNALGARIDLSALTADEQKAAMDAIGIQIVRHDLQDQAELKALTPKAGWFSISTYGRDGQLAAWLIVEHATNDPPLMRSTLAALDRMRRTGEAPSTAYAIMYDRVALTFDHKPQRYGTQLDCQDGHEHPKSLEDPDRLDARRKAMGFDQSEADYVKSMDDGYCRRIR